MLSRPGVRRMPCSTAFPSAPALGSTGSADASASLFAGFTATMAGSDFSCPFITGYGSSPSRCGPVRLSATRPGKRSPRFRRVPCVRDVASDPGRATQPRLAVPLMLPSTSLTASAPANGSISWLNPTPLTLAVYASPWSSPSTPQHSLLGGRYPLPTPDFHRLELASFLAHQRTERAACRSIPGETTTQSR
jgi:hypothetical protein